MTDSPASLYLKDVVEQFHKLKALGDRALAQVRDEDLFVTLDPESNSLAILIQHMAGNLLSRWTDFLSSDGEKPDRDRDSEFTVREGTTRASSSTAGRRGGAASSRPSPPFTRRIWR